MSILSGDKVAGSLERARMEEYRRDCARDQQHSRNPIHHAINRPIGGRHSGVGIAALVEAIDAVVLRFAAPSAERATCCVHCDWLLLPIPFREMISHDYQYGQARQF
jgi:hypothetical protein